MIQRPRLVIIDDDPSYRDPLAGLLAKDFQVVVTTCGQEGVSRLLTTRPDLVLFGLPIRSCDALQTLRAISQNHRLREIPLLLIAAPASANLEDLRHRGFHVDDLLPKDRSLWKSLPPKLLALLKTTPPTPTKPTPPTPTTGTTAL